MINTRSQSKWHKNNKIDDNQHEIALNHYPVTFDREKYPQNQIPQAIEGTIQAD